MKHFFAYLFLGITIGASFMIVIFVFVLQADRPPLEEVIISEQVKMDELNEGENGDVSTEALRAAELYAGDSATCIDVFENETLKNQAEKNGYEVIGPEGYNLEILQLTSVCKTETDNAIQIYAHELDDLDQVLYLWTIMVKDNSGWNKYDFEDSLQPIYGPTCFVDEIADYHDSGELKDQIRLVTLTCMLGDGGFGEKFGYVLDRVDASISPIYHCRIKPNVLVTHPETFDVLYERFDEECEVLF